MTLISNLQDSRGLWVFSGTSSFDALAMIKEINTMRAVGSHPNLVGLIAQCLSKGCYFTNRVPQVGLTVNDKLETKLLYKRDSLHIFFSGAPLCIMAYEGKNLRKHLREHKFGDYSRPDSAHRRLLSHCLDVANGMNYLFQLKVRRWHSVLGFVF